MSSKLRAASKVLIALHRVQDGGADAGRLIPNANSVLLGGPDGRRKIRGRSPSSRQYDSEGLRVCPHAHAWRPQMDTEPPCM